MKKFAPVFVLSILMIGLTLISLPQLASADDPVIGEIIQYAGDTPPDGWLLTDGSAVSRTLYADLFGLIGTSYGPGDGSTTFNVPNVEGTPVGAVMVWPGYTTTIPSGWLYLNGQVLSIYDYPDLYSALSYGSIYGGPMSYFFLPDTRERFVMGSNGQYPFASTYVGKTGGAMTHTLTISEIPSHAHYRPVWYGTPDGNSPYYPVETLSGNSSYNASLANTGSTGGGQAHSILNPYIAMNWIIKAKPDPDFIIYTGVYSSTPTPTPTATPYNVYIPYIYTHTLGSGHELHVPVQASFGQLIISAAILALLAVRVLWFIFGVVH